MSGRNEDGIGSGRLRRLIRSVAIAASAAVAVVLGVAVVSAQLPEFGRSSTGLTSSNIATVDRTRSDIKIIYSAGDTATNTVTFWAKNVGTSTIQVVEDADLLLNTPTGAKRVPYNAGPENWTYVIEDAEPTWIPTTTLKVTATLTALPAGFYQVKFSLSNSAFSTDDFSV